MTPNVATQVPTGRPVPASLLAAGSGKDLRPVGIFDSGVGGVTILRELHAQAPGEHCLYVADSREAPYGEKSAAEIIARCVGIVEFLLAHNAKLIVVACNAASVVALPHLRATYEVPFVGIVPAVKPASALTRTKRIGVLTTPTTAQSDSMAHLIEEFADGVTVITAQCPDLVPLIERGILEGPRIEGPVHRYLEALLAERVDVIALGCTHYPLLRAMIERICGPNVIVLDPANAVARQARRVLLERGLEGDDTASATEYFTTGPASEFREVLALIGAPEALAVVGITI